MKTCPTCGPKPVTEFTPGQSKCRPCRREHRRGKTYYPETAKRRLERKQCHLAIGQHLCVSCERIYPETQQRCLCGRLTKPREGIKALVKRLRAETPCLDCGQKYLPEVMHFHHRPDEIRVDSVSSLVAKKKRVAALAEIAKCDLLCTLCHEDRHRE